MEKIFEIHVQHPKTHRCEDELIIMRRITLLNGNSFHISSVNLIIRLSKQIIFYPREICRKTSAEMAHTLRREKFCRHSCGTDKFAGIYISPPYSGNIARHESMETLVNSLSVA